MEDNIIVYRKKRQFNIGMVLFGIIFLYLIAMIVLYVTTKRTTAYEVRMGSILNDKAYTGIAIREETVVNAEQSGYINYYSTENAKVKVGTKMYVTSDTELTEDDSASSKDEESKKQLTSDQQTSLGILVQSFSDSFSDEMFSDVYSFKDAVRNSVSSISSFNKTNYLNELLGAGTGVLSQSSNDGIVVYSADGFESLKAEDVTTATFEKSNYHSKEFYNNMKVGAGDPVYKLITSENWKVVVPISKSTKESLTGKNNVKVRFAKDKETLIAGLKIAQKDGQDMAYLSFNSAMIRYAGERFLDIELILEDGSGLKIPKSALTRKPFYVVPLEYLTQGGNSSEKGVLRKGKDKDGEEIIEFITTTIYYTENNMAYLDPAVLSEGDVLLKPESTLTYIVGDQKKLAGVFNINKGYAVFKQIKILCESDDYYIVEAGNDYGLANYDHIALNSKNVKENDVISQ